MKTGIHENSVRPNQRSASVQQGPIFRFDCSSGKLHVKHLRTKTVRRLNYGSLVNTMRTGLSCL